MLRLCYFPCAANKPGRRAGPFNETLAWGEYQCPPGVERNACDILLISSGGNLRAGGQAVKRLSALVKCFVFIYKTLNHETDPNKLGKSQRGRKVYEACRTVNVGSASTPLSCSRWEGDRPLSCAGVTGQGGGGRAVSGEFVPTCCPAAGHFAFRFQMS